MAFPPNHHTPERQAARANKRYERARKNGATLAVDLIKQSGMSRSAWYRAKSKKDTTPDIENMDQGC
jgi:hypothetical protein